MNGPTIARAVVRLVDLRESLGSAPFAYETDFLKAEWEYEEFNGFVVIVPVSDALSVVKLRPEGIAVAERIIAAGCDVLAARKAGA